MGECAKRTRPTLVRQGQSFTYTLFDPPKGKWFFRSEAPFLSTAPRGPQSGLSCPQDLQSPRGESSQRSKCFLLLYCAHAPKYARILHPRSKRLNYRAILIIPYIHKKASMW